MIPATTRATETNDGTLQTGDIIINTRTVLIITGNCNASGSTREAEVYDRKTGEFKGLRSYSADKLWSNLDATWTLYRPGHAPRRAPSYTIPEARLRCKVHSLSRKLGLCEGARRNILISLTSSRYARDLNAAELEVVVAFLESRLALQDRRTLHVPEYVSDESALDILGEVA